MCVYVCVWSVVFVCVCVVCVYMCVWCVYVCSVCSVCLCAPACVRACVCVCVFLWACQITHVSHFTCHWMLNAYHCIYVYRRTMYPVRAHHTIIRHNTMLAGRWSLSHLTTSRPVFVLTSHVSLLIVHCHHSAYSLTHTEHSCLRCMRWPPHWSPCFVTSHRVWIAVRVQPLHQIRNSGRPAHAEPGPRKHDVTARSLTQTASCKMIGGICLDRWQIVQLLAL